MDYMVYKYILRPHASHPLFQKETAGRAKALLGKAQQILGGIFMEGGDQALPIIREKRGNDELLQNSVQRRLEDILLLNINNNKTQKYREGHEDREFQSHPGCFVIIDNRPGVAQMLIERTSAFGCNPNLVAKMMQDAINLKLVPYGLEIEIRNKLRETSFWQMVNRRIDVDNDSVRQITFHLQSPVRVAGIDAGKRALRKLNTLIGYVQSVKGCRANFSIEAGSDEPLRLDQAEEDVAQLVSLCSTNAFSIEVRFQRYGLYRFGDKEHACLSMPDSVVDDFINETAEPTLFATEFCPLTEQLDIARKITDGYDESPIKKKRGKKNNQQSIRQASTIQKGAGCTE